MPPPTGCRRTATGSATSATRRRSCRTALSCSARGSQPRVGGSRATYLCALLVHSTGCFPRSCSARISCSSWAGRRVDRAPRPVEIAAGCRALREEAVVERVRVVEVAVRSARLLRHMELVGAELIPAVGVLRLEVTRLLVVPLLLRQ